jgi:putative serine protease PepD
LVTGGIKRAVAAVAVPIAGGTVALALASGSAATRSATVTATAPGAGGRIAAALAAPRGLTINQIYRRDSPGVVDIVATTEVNFPGLRVPGLPGLPGLPPLPGLPRLPGLPGLGNGFGIPPIRQRSEGEGAGVVYDSRGDILTDEHVVAGARSVTVSFANGRRARARVLGSDPSTDVAVLRVSVPASVLEPIPFADSSAAQVGDPVVAIGSPFGLPETTTSGIVSAVGRSIQAPDGYTIAGAIQTDAPINPGNSGGPLLDAAGRVLGLVDQIASTSGSSSGVGFAIPANVVARIANAIIAGRPVRHAYLGVGLDPAATGGAEVASVVLGSPADRAGLRRGDVITAIDGKPIGSSEQLIEAIDAYPPGRTVTLSVRRGSRTLTLAVKLGARPRTLPSG